MAHPAPDPNNPQPKPGNPNPEPARPPFPSEAPPAEPPGIPPPTPDPVPDPGQAPVELPPATPDEVPQQPDFPAPTAVLLSAAIMIGLLDVHPSRAQQPQSPPPASEACRAAPQDNGRDGDAAAAGQSPQVMLEDCDGVLKPPRTGAPQIEETPPDIGTTPVIPPGQIPAQPPG